MNPWEKYGAVAQTGDPKPWEKYGAPPTKTADAPHGTSEQPKQRTGGFAEAVVEPALQMATGAIAKPVSDVAGLAALGKEAISPTPGGGDPLGFKREVQNRLTYEPRTKAGQMSAEYNPLALAGKGIGWGSEKAGSAIRGNAGADTLRGAVGNAVQEGLTQLPQFVGAKAGEAVGKGIPKAQAALDKAKGENSVADATRAKAQAAGYITPPEGGIKGAAAGIAGKAKTEKAISEKNTETATRNLGKEVGVQAGEPLSKAVRENLKDKAGDAYEQMTQAAGKELKPTKAFRTAFKSTIDQLNRDIKINKVANKDLIPARDLLESVAKQKEFPTDNALRTIKRQRALAKTDFKNGNQEMGTARLAVSEQLENLFQDNLAKSGKQDLVDQFKAARVQFAKLYLLDRIVNDATGKVDLQKLAALSETKAYKGALSGAFQDAADFAKAYRKAAQKSTGEGVPRLTVFDGMFGLGMLASGHPLLGATELATRYGVPIAAEKGMLEKPPSDYQVSRARKSMPYVLPGAGVGIGQQSQLSTPPQ